MHFFKTFLPLALFAGPILASPVAINAATGDLETRSGDIESRADTVKCEAKDITKSGKKGKNKTKSFTVDVDTAKDLVKSLGVDHKDATGYPHAYSNGDGLQWDESACKKTNVDFLEYPVFWKGGPKELDQSETIKSQPHSPIRVVYANAGGTAVYCGIMIHSDVEEDSTKWKKGSWIGSSGFSRCT